MVVKLRSKVFGGACHYRMAGELCGGMYKVLHLETNLSETAQITQTLNAFFSIIYVRNNVRFLPATATHDLIMT